jgi:hypothetical protein
MQTIRQVFGFFLLLLSTAWWLSDPTDAASLTHVFAWRAVLLQYTGVLAIGVMALALVLAVRPVVFEPWLGGLDKMYRLHKWLGITALGASLAHWLLAVVPSQLVGLGSAPGRVCQPAAPTCPRSNGCSRRCAARPGRGGGEWAFYLAVLMMMLALVRSFPYRYFFKASPAGRSLPGPGLACAGADARGLLGRCAGAALALLVLAAASRRCGCCCAAWRPGARRWARCRPSPGTRPCTRWSWQSTSRAAGPGTRRANSPLSPSMPKKGRTPSPSRRHGRGTGASAFSSRPWVTTRALEHRLRVGSVVQVEGPYGQFTFEGARARRSGWAAASALRHSSRA